MVHQYQLNGYNIVLDTASGSVHGVDEVAYPPTRRHCLFPFFWNLGLILPV